MYAFCKEIVRALNLEGGRLEALLRDTENLNFALETGRPLSDAEREDVGNCLRQLRHCLELLSGRGGPARRPPRRAEQLLLFESFP
jgi:hypothetical protein